MEKKTLMTATKDSISDVLETMFFLPLDYSETDTIEDLWKPGSSEPLAVKLDFNGPFSGTFFLFIPKKIARTLTEGFMGMDKDRISQEHVNETVKEIVNMIAGGTFSHYDKNGVFHLGIPDLVSPDTARANDPGSDNVIFIPIDTLEDRLALILVAGD